jgi:hypothetical protein
MLSKLLREETPDHVAVVFDAPGGTFRDALYAGYKETRGPMPDELRPQIPYIRRLVAALRLPVIEEAGVEADDVLGTLAKQATAAGIQTVIVTGDKDMMQLVDERTTLYDTMRDRRIGVAEVRARFGVEPERAHVATVGRERSGDDPDGGGLAGAVGPEQHRDPSGTGWSVRRRHAPKFFDTSDDDQPWVLTPTGEGGRLSRGAGAAAGEGTGARPGARCAGKRGVGGGGWGGIMVLIGMGA